MARMDDGTLISGTIADLDSVIENLRIKKAELEERIRDAESRRDAWRLRLKQLAPSNSNKKRLRKGAALDAINAVFSGTIDGTGLTISEIAKAAGIAWSSIRNAINKPGSGYFERHGRFYQIAESREEKNTANGVHGGNEPAKK